MNDSIPTGPLQVINIGLESFAEDLRAQGVAVIQLDWRPPAGGNARLASLLAGMDDED
jgi:FdrA protein